MPDKAPRVFLDYDQAALDKTPLHPAIETTVGRLDPLRPTDTLSLWRLIVAYRAIIDSAEHMVNRIAVFREG